MALQQCDRFLSALGHCRRESYWDTAAAAGADGLIVEVHPRPEEALCDRDQALTGQDLEQLVALLQPIVGALGRTF